MNWQGQRQAHRHGLDAKIPPSLLMAMSAIVASIGIVYSSQTAAATMLHFDYEVEGFANDQGFTGGVLSLQVQGTVQDVFPNSQRLDITSYRGTFRTNGQNIDHFTEDLSSDSMIDFRIEPGAQPNDASVFFVQLESNRDNINFFLLNPGEGFFSSVRINGQLQGCDPLFGPACTVRRTVRQVPLDL